jgi:DNA polymerase-3 subunit beta
MKFTIQKDLFEEALNQSSRFTSSKLSGNQSLLGAYIKTTKEKLTIITTNLNDFYTTTIPIKSQTEGEAVIDLRKTTEFLHFLPQGDVEVEKKEGIISIVMGKTKAAINIFPIEEFPLPQEIEGDIYIFGKKEIKNISQVSFSSSKDEARPVLTGTLITNKNNKTIFVTTDGFRLSFSSINEVKNLENFIIPTWVLEEAIQLSNGKGIEIKKSKKENIISISAGPATIYSRLLTGDFPPFERVIPEKYETRVKLKKEDLAKSVRIAAVFAKDQADVVILNITKKDIYITPKGQKREDSSVFLETEEISGEPLNIAFNYKYILDFLSHLESDSVVLEFTQSTAPGVFKEKGNEDYIHIIMPLRTEETAALD